MTPFSGFALLALVLAVPDAKHDTDTSGAYESRKLYHATTLSVFAGQDEAVFSYLGAFGPGCTKRWSHVGSWCRTCDFGPVTARRDTPQSYSFADEYGTVRLVRTSEGWTLELVSGMFGWCGMGWSGDSFALKGQPADACVVTVAESRLYSPSVKNEGEPQPTETTLKQGQRIETFPAAHEDDQYLIARVDSSIGLVKTHDVKCESH